MRNPKNTLQRPGSVYHNAGYLKWNCTKFKLKDDAYIKHKWAIS